MGRHNGRARKAGERVGATLAAKNKKVRNAESVCVVTAECILFKVIRHRWERHQALPVKPVLGQQHLVPVLAMLRATRAAASCATSLVAVAMPAPTLVRPVASNPV